MSNFRAFCDEFYITTRLFLKLDLHPSRETVLHFFERIRREFPTLSKLRRREDGGVILEEPDGSAESRRYVRLDGESLRFGFHNPSDSEEFAALARCVLAQAPHHLSLSDLDVDHMETVYGFDLEYRGNHDELVAEALFADHPLAANLTGENQRVIDCQPFWGVSLSPECDLQAYVEIKSRTSTFEVRSNEFERSALTVFSTVRRYWGFGPPREMLDVQNELLKVGEDFASQRVVPYVVQPLAQAIGSG